MRVERIEGHEMTAVLRRLRDRLGDDALVLRTNRTATGLEVVATTPAELERYEATLRAEGVVREPGRRSRVIALVGPTGSGKTTTAAKLALSDAAFAGGRIGLISLDTYKIGAFDQIQTYADLGGFVLEVLADPAEVPNAAARLSRCDWIIVDTPGRTPAATAGERAWRTVLAKLQPDEVHLVLPATVRFDIASAVRSHYAELGLTHLLLTKVDEVPGEAGVAQLAGHLELPTRWLADGQGVPDDLHLAPERLVRCALAGRLAEHPAEAIA